MVDVALQALGISANIEIHIEKQLPIQGGLGAGSANAVAALVGLEAELGIDARAGTAWASARLKLAEQVGSDVPLFLIGGAVLGLDRGQQVFPLPDLEPAWCVVAIPPVGVSTPQAFRDWDALCQRTGLTAEASEAKLNELSRAYASSFAGVDAWDGSSGVSSQNCNDGGGDLAGPQVSALIPHRDSERLRKSCLSAASPSQRDQAHSCGSRYSGGSPPCVLVRVRFSTLWPLPRRKRSRSSPRTTARYGSAKLVDPHPPALGLLAANASEIRCLTAAPEHREKLACGCPARMYGQG